jgi:hypothetical protein
VNFDPSEYEPLLDDDRVERIAHKIKSEFGFKKLEDSVFFTFIQPARPYNQRTPEGLVVPTWIPDMAVFAIISPRPNPTRPGQKLMSQATASLEGWLEAEKEASHFAGAPDEAHKIFKAVARMHLQQLQSAKELIH